MGLLVSLIFLILGIGTALLALIFLQPEFVFNLIKPLPPKKDVFPFEDRVWTASGKASTDTEIRSFKIAVPNEALEDLKQRLLRTRYGPRIVGTQFTYGFPSGQLKKVVDYWLKGYDWREQEIILNQYPHFLTSIEGLDIHFVQAKAQNVEKEANWKTYPIALFHGWPGSFFELYKIAALLTAPQKIGSRDSVAFEVVIPSMPGYAFSQAAETPGMDPCNMARIYDRLMARLGHAKYFIYGGDWGSVVARCMSVMYPDRILGMDITMFPVPMFPTVLIKTIVAQFSPALAMDPAESYKLFSMDMVYDLVQELGFTHIQATKPDTIGAVLSDSPAGLAAYILEKFTFFTRPEFRDRSDGGLTDFYTLDDLLTNVMLYWTTNSIQSAVRIYKENCGYFGCGNATEMPRFPVLVPTVLSDFRFEVPSVNAPKDFVKPYFRKLVKFSHHEEGGHFSALERPNDLADDIWTLLTYVLENQTSN